GGMTGLCDQESIDLLTDVSFQLSKALLEFFNEYNYDGGADDSKKPLKILAEPGRYFITSSHTLVITVIGRKEKYTSESGSNPIMYYYVNESTYSSFN